MPCFNSLITYVVVVKFIEPGLPMIVKDQNCFDHSENKYDGLLASYLNFIKLNIFFINEDFSSSSFSNFHKPIFFFLAQSWLISKRFL